MKRRNSKFVSGKPSINDIFELRNLEYVHISDVPTSMEVFSLIIHVSCEHIYQST